MARTPVEPPASPKPKPAPRTATKPAAKPAAKVAPKPAAVPAPILRKKDLVELVQKSTKAKKKDVKDIVEATLAALGEALSGGHDLNLPPFGRAKVNRQKDTGQGEMIVLRLRRNGPPDSDATDAPKPAKETLAETGD